MLPLDNSPGKLFFYPHGHPKGERPSNKPVDDALVLRYRVYTRRIRRMLYLGGVLQDRTRSVFWSYVMGLLVIVMFSSQCFFVMNFCRDHTDNLLLLSKCFGLTCSLLAPVVMSACFLVKREKLMELHEMLDDLFERELAQDQETALATLYAFDRPFYLLVLVLASTMLFLYSSPLISMFHQIIHDVQPRKYRLLLPARFLWPLPSSGFFFFLHVLYQLSSCWMIFTISGVDSLFGFYAFQISSTLRAMSARLRNPRADDVFTGVLKTCVETHNRLLRCGHMLEDIWGFIIMRILLTNAILMCVLIFEATPFTELTISQASVFVSYMTLKLLQAFIYAWYGGLVTSASEHFREGIYFGEWTDSSCDRHVRATVIVTMMQKPMIIKAMKVSSINVNMFTTIVNTAMSYFFFLQSLDEGR
ncbi:ObirOr5-F1 [Ooceraea biroi]|uniref:Odorant receptor n=1 Tax=Ooceraea biroi TaxID=2015173 RepID=A0A026WWU3_OOCBI|nr:hypothetical protein X777_13392 [Ooceraea biroi]RLU16423.1 ObirOr5-F1 [Ooceraea biroi]